MTGLELLAPAKTVDIGIAAIDCGVDAVYIAGPAFGARQAAGNSMEDIEKLCSYAHRFGVKIFLTLNTILYDDEIDDAWRLMCAAEDAGVDALIVQDLAILQLAAGGPDGLGHQIHIPLHASTQCAIRDIRTAIFYRKLGFSRLVLERELPLNVIREISHAATGCEIEFFVHGALCVCYSGQCYLSEHLAGRSANRGECIQACRSLYNLVDGHGKTLVKNKALLSLKDYNLKDRIEDLAEAGVTSFKIEGRLKNMSYVQNTVRAYSSALDNLVAKYPDRYMRTSFGMVHGGFSPDLDKTFNRGYTELFLSGQRGKWSSMDTPKGMGEKIGKILTVKRCANGEFELAIDLLEKAGQIRLTNGDGFAATGDGGTIIGFRGNVCNGNIVRCRTSFRLLPGMTIWRNLSVDFEKVLSSSTCRRLLHADIDITVSGSREPGYSISFRGITEDGRTASVRMDAGPETADNPERAVNLIRMQMEKSAGDFIFRVHEISVRTDDGNLPFIHASAINAMRRALADKFSATPAVSIPMNSHSDEQGAIQAGDASFLMASDPSYDYKYNIANHLSHEIYRKASGRTMGSAYEISHYAGAELMRTKYCIRHELGICPKFHGVKDSRPLFLENNGKRLLLNFDCRKCEMTLSASHSAY